MVTASFQSQGRSKKPPAVEVVRYPNKDAAWTIAIHLPNGQVGLSLAEAVALEAALAAAIEDISDRWPA